MKNHGVRHEIVLVLTPEMLERHRRKKASRMLGQDLTASGRGEVDLGDIDAIRVTWEFWKIERSQYHYREPGHVDLGEIE